MSEGYKEIVLQGQYPLSLMTRPEAIFQKLEGLVLCPTQVISPWEGFLGPLNNLLSWKWLEQTRQLAAFRDLIN